MEKNYIAVRRRQVRHVIELYTMQGLTQEEIGQIVFPQRIETKIDRKVLVRRILHVFGLNMSNRKNYKQEGLTQKIIDDILDNYLVIYPITIPLDGEGNQVINFDTELISRVKGQGQKKSVYIGIVQNLIAVAIIVALQVSAHIADFNSKSALPYMLAGLPILAFIIVAAIFSKDK